MPHFNVVNGGAHAPNSLDFQEFMLAPLGAPSIAEAIRAGAQVYATLKGLLHDAGYATGLGDEGGFAPDISRPEDVLRTAGPGHHRRRLHRRSGRRRDRDGPGVQRVLP